MACPIRERTGIVIRTSRVAATALAVLSLLAVSVVGCSPKNPATQSVAGATTTVAPKTSGGKGMKTIYIAGGCFWGLEKYIAAVHGVVGTEVGYANGANKTATYGDSSGYAEAVKVDYDPSIAPLPFLLDLFYEAVDPTSVNRQGNDMGTEYRTGIYYTDPADRTVVEHSLAELQKRHAKPIAIEEGPLTTYARAEDYHQDYLVKHPDGYCHIPTKLFKAAAAARPK
jgi:peptide methionine sulfoxide reductase msrA/msrB